MLRPVVYLEPHPGHRADINFPVQVVMNISCTPHELAQHRIRLFGRNDAYEDVRPCEAWLNGHLGDGHDRLAEIKLAHKKLRGLIADDAGDAERSLLPPLTL